jgi:hypothetical protein
VCSFNNTGCCGAPLLLMLLSDAEAAARTTILELLQQRLDVAVDPFPPQRGRCGAQRQP